MAKSRSTDVVEEVPVTPIAEVTVSREDRKRLGYYALPPAVAHIQRVLIDHEHDDADLVITVTAR